MNLGLLTLCSLFLTAAAQTNSHTTSILNGSPNGSFTSSSALPSQTFIGFAPYGTSACALRCSFGPSHLCSPTDLTCLCTNLFYENSVEDCMLINCGGELQAARRIHGRFCEPVRQSLAASSSSVPSSMTSPAPNGCTIPVSISPTLLFGTTLGNTLFLVLATNCLAYYYVA